MPDTSISGIFGFNVSEIFALIAFLIFVYLVAGNAKAFSSLLVAGAGATTSTITALQGR